MFNKTRNILFLLLIGFALSVYGCGDKKDGDGTTKESSGENSDLVSKDSTGNQRITLAIRPKKGDIFRYKVTGKQTSKETAPQQTDKFLESEQALTYYCSMEVADVDGSNVVTYKMKYDSLTITSTVKAQDSSRTTVYNSNIKDSVYNNPNFIDFNALVGETFSLRVSPNGEVYDVLGTEKIADKIFKALGDTLKEDTKKSIREALESDVIRRVMQVENQFMKFPDHPVYKDSTWTRTENSMIPPFPTKNIASYKLKEVKEENGETVLVFEANLGIEFLEKEIKERGVTVTMENSTAGGSGTITFNLSRGCIVKKETGGKVDATIKLSDGKQSATSVQQSTNSYTIELLK